MDEEGTSLLLPTNDNKDDIDDVKSKWLAPALNQNVEMSKSRCKVGEDEIGAPDDRAQCAKLIIVSQRQVSWSAKLHKLELHKRTSGIEMRTHTQLSEKNRSNSVMLTCTPPLVVRLHRLLLP